MSMSQRSEGPASDPAHWSACKESGRGELAREELHASRRAVLAAALGAAATAFATTGSAAVLHTRAAGNVINEPRGDRQMNTVTTKDGTQISFKDWGSGRPVVFSHGWPLTSDAFEDQMFHLASSGFRVIAHDRRGHGRSSQPWNGNDMDTYADDLAELVRVLDIKDAVHVGHSTGGGEVVRYIGRHGTARVGKVVLISAIPPLMLRTEANPLGLPMNVFDDIRANVLSDRSQFWRELSLPFFGYNRPGANISEGVREQFVYQSMMAGFPASYFCIQAFSETDLTEDLKKIRVPTLVIHGDDDQIVPVQASALRSSKIIPHATLKIYTGAPHGLPTTHKAKLNADLTSFCSA